MSGERQPILPEKNRLTLQEKYLLRANGFRKQVKKFTLSFRNSYIRQPCSALFLRTASKMSSLAVRKEL
jgi:hypothetical protein